MRKTIAFLCIILIILISGCTKPVNSQRALQEKAAQPKTIVLYTGVNLQDITPVVQRFTELSGIKVNVWKSSSTKVVARTLEESRANKLQAHVVILNEADMAILRAESILIPYLGKAWHPIYMQFITLAYNTKVITNPPRTYHDLLKPEYNGKLAMEIDSPEWEKGLKEILGQDFFNRLHSKLENQEIRGVDGKRLFSELVIAGEVPIAINLNNNYIEQAKKKGAPVEWIPLEPVVASPETAALLADSEEAKQFIDFLLSTEG